ncbi:hypothetical protein [Methanobacterium sp. SMA-27]|uniref:hypothetical protein n=1 Tax=Methanobacterium sp. SMA-27 TaxID=1495336 RepID=UPI00064F2B3A|nr:hypothetical protein [Methanobacterium sp. SMA-27]
MKNFILTFREEYDKLSDEEKELITNLEDLNKPLQVESVWIKNDELDIDLQFHFFTHFKDENDLDIKVELLDSRDYIDFLNEYLKKKKWNKLLHKDESIPFIKDRKYSDEIKIILINGIEMFKNYVQTLHSDRKRTNSSLMKCRINLDAFGWVHLGKIQEIEPKNEVFNIITQIKLKPKQNSHKPPEAKIEKNLIDGFGTFFYPPIWIGDQFPIPSLKDILNKKPLVQFTKTIQDINYKNKILIIKSDGFIAIGESNKKKAIKKLNEIMAIALLFDIPVSIINESELGTVEIDPEDRRIGSQSMPINSMRTNLINAQWNIPINIEFNRIKVSENKIYELFNIAEKIKNDKIFKDFSIFYLESYTHFTNYLYSQSFIISWLILERYLSNLWKEKIIDKIKEDNKQDKNRENDLKNPGRWSAYYIIETLNLLGIIKNEQYKTFMELKRKRDKIVHEGQDCSKEESKKCLDLAKRILSENLVHNPE